MKGYREQLTESARRAGTLLCIGIDPLPESLPAELAPAGIAGVIPIVEAALAALRERGLAPAAFKPNIGYFHAADRPRAGDFAGSRALAMVLDAVRAAFPEVPVILDAKRADIARSSANYAREAFDCWGVDAVTVAPFMGSDSVGPFLEAADRAGHGVYLLTRTSNPGAAELQNLPVTASGTPLYREVARSVVAYAGRHPSCGAVVAATAPRELAELLELFREARIPLLVPGVGRQGGSAEATIDALRASDYPLELVRINASSGALFPWGAQPGGSWRDSIGEAIARLHAACTIER